MRPIRPQQGFTVIEMTVVMVVLALMLALAVPNVGGWLRNIRIRNQAESIQNGLQQARAEAVRRNTPVSFWLVTLNDPTQMDNSCAVSSSGTSWVVSLDAPDGQCDSAPDANNRPRLVSAHNAGDGGGTVRITGLQSDGSSQASSVTFDAFGRVSATGTDLQYITVAYAQADARTDDRPLRVEISAAGSVRMCDPQVRSPDARVCTFP